MFTLDAWRCWYDLLEPEVNDAGWGYDYSIHNFCKNRIPNFVMGVVHSMLAKHHSHIGQQPLPHINNCRVLDRAQQAEHWLHTTRFRQNVSYPGASFKYLGPPLI